jgi:Ca2+/Na+ antiporter
LRWEVICYLLNCLPSLIKLSFHIIPLTWLIFLQYSQRHSVINHCDRHITLLKTVILIYLLVCLIYLLILVCLLGDSKQYPKGKRNFEDICNRKKDISKSPRWVIGLTISLTVLYSFMCRYVSKLIDFINMIWYLNKKPLLYMY